MFDSGYYASLAPIIYIETGGFWSSMIVGALGSVIGAAATGLISYKLLQYSHKKNIENQRKEGKNKEKELDYVRLNKILSSTQIISSSLSSMNRSIHESISDYIKNHGTNIDYTIAIKPLIGYIPLADLPSSDDLIILQKMNAHSMIKDLALIVMNHNTASECINKYNRLHEDFQNVVIKNSKRDPKTGLAIAFLLQEGGIEIELKRDSLNNLMKSIIFDLRDDLIKVSKLVEELDKKTNSYFGESINLTISSKIELYAENFKFIKR